MRRKRAVLEPQVVSVEYARPVPADAIVAIAIELLHHILYSRNQLPCPVMRLPNTVSEASSSGANRRQVRKLLRTAESVRHLDKSIEELFRASRVLELAFVLGSSPMAPKETVIIDFRNVGAGEPCDESGPTDPKLLHQFSRKAVLALLRQTEDAGGIRRGARTATLCNVLALVEDAGERNDETHDFVLHPSFELRPPKKAGRNPHFRVELGCSQTEATTTEQSSMKAPTWWSSRTRIRGLRSRKGE